MRYDLDVTDTLLREAVDAVADGDLDAIGRFVDAHPELVGRDELLHESAGYKRLETVRYLLDRGWTLQGTGEHYLIYAVIHGATEPADHFASLGARSRLFWVAAGMGWADVVDEYFTADGALSDRARLGRVDLEDYGMPAHPMSDDLEDVLQEGLISAARMGRIDMVRGLLARGAVLDRPYHLGTAIHWAAYNDQTEMVEFLASIGADMTLRDAHWNGTPRGWATAGGHTDLAVRMEALGSPY